MSDHSDRNTPASANGRPHRGEDLVQLVDLTRRRLRFTWLATGGCVLVAGALGWLILAAGIDMLAPLPVALRLLMATLLWLVLAAAVGLGIIWPAMRPLTANQVARRIERTVPSMKNRLLSVVDLHQRSTHPEGDGPDKVNRRFYQRLLDETRARLQNYKLEQVVNPRPLRWGTAAAVGVIVLTFGMALLMHEAMPAAVARIVRPTAEIPPVSHVKLEADGDLDALRGDPLTIPARIARGSVESLNIRLRPAGGGAWAQHPMQRRDDGSWAFEISSVDRDYVYEVHGGGTWTRAARIAAVPRPVVREAAVAVLLPQYMGLPEPLAVKPDATQVVAPVGGHLRVAAVVDENPVAGEVVLLDSATTREKVTDEREVVWIEDDIPGDADPAEATAARLLIQRGGSFSGQASFRLEPGQPLSFTTRLEAMAAEPDQSVFVYLRNDPRRPASQVQVTLPVFKRDEPLQWTIPLSTTEKLGEWVRHDTSLTELLGRTPKGDRRLVGLTAEAESGVVQLDRVGVLTRETREVEQVKVTEAGVVPMSRDEATGRWVGLVPVEKDGQFTVRFRNTLGAPSPELRPLTLDAIDDAAPLITQDRPGPSLVVSEPIAVPITATAVDDFGVDAVGIVVARDEKAKGDPRWLTTFEQPVTVREVVTAIDLSSQEHGGAGTIYYRLAVRDRKGQVAFTEPAKIVLVDPSAPPPDAAVVKRPNNNKLLEALGKLLDLPVDLAQLPLDLLKDLPEELLQNPDAEPPVALTSEQAKQLEQWRELVEQRQELLKKAAEEFLKAAKAAAESPLTTDAEAAALAAMQAQLDAMAQDSPSPEDMAQDQAALKEMQEQLGEMADLAQQLASDPQQAQQAMADMMAKARAQQAAAQLDRLGQHLEQQEQQLAQMKDQLGDLREQVAQAQQSGQLDELSKQQAALDPQAMAAMEQAQELLGQQQQAEQNVPPWTPPGERREAMPVEQDTPDPNAAQQQAQPDAGQQQPEQPEENWWDQPAPVETPQAAQVDERFADRQQPQAQQPAGEQGQPQQTPREMLQEHQEQMQQQLTQTAQDVSSAREQVEALAQQAAALAQGAQPPSSPGQAQAQQPEGQQPGAPMPAGSLAQQVAEMMSSEAMAQAAAMAQRAMGQQMAQGQQPAPPGPGSPLEPQGISMGPMDEMLRPPGALIEGPMEMGDAGRRAGLYRLPPQVRQPLLEGMAERGPSGYQPIIDAYFRQLVERATDEK